MNSPGWMVISRSARFLDAHQQTARHHQKHLVFMVVMTPDELALQLDQLPMVSR